jgi:hypothetical protein
MKTLKFTLGLFIMFAFFGWNEAYAQWNASGNNIYNTNTANVGIGSNSPITLLHVAKSMTEPTITVQNLGGAGGATYSMIDNASGAYWKFKATNTGGFKIRDNANAKDVIVIEPYTSSTNALYIKGTGNVGIGTSTPAASAIVDMSSTTKGFLPPRMTQVQIGAIESPVNGLIVFCTDDDKFYAYIAAANTWKELLFGSGTITPPTSCGTSLIINHVAGSVAPVSKTVTYGLVNNIPGEPTKCWITSNLGADQQAASVDDATEASSGWYWQYNRMQGYKHDGTTRTPNSTWITSINENIVWEIANDPCALELGAGWRIPTYTEWTNVDAAGGWTEWSGPWNSALKLHAAGFLNSTGSSDYRGTIGYYLNSTQYDNTNGWILGFSSGNCQLYNGDKANGWATRCIKD